MPTGDEWRIEPVTVGNDAYMAFARRTIAAAGRRVGAGDVWMIGELAQLHQAVDAALTAAVCGLIAEGYSWAEIARPLCITKQSAHEKWKHDVKRT